MKTVIYFALAAALATGAYFGERAAEATGCHKTIVVSLEENFGPIPPDQSDRVHSEITKACKAVLSK